MNTSEYNNFNKTQFDKKILLLESIPRINWIAVWAVIVLIVITVILNVIMLFLLRSRCDKRRIIVLLTNLAIANLFVMLLIMPLKIMLDWPDWQINDSTCHLILLLKDFPLYLTGFLLVCIAIDRYKDMTDSCSLSNNSGVVMAVTSWSLAVLCSLPEAIISHFKEDNEVNNFRSCTALAPFNSPVQELIINVASMCAMYGFPAIIIICLYGLSYAENSRKSKITKQTVHSQPLWTDDSRDSQKLLLKMSAVMACFFIICSSPFQIMYNCLPAFGLSNWIYDFMFIFQLAYSIVNPIIYIIFYFCD